MPPFAGAVLVLAMGIFGHEPITRPAAMLRDSPQRVVSDRLFSTLAGSASLWKPPAATTMM